MRLLRCFTRKGPHFLWNYPLLFSASFYPSPLLTSGPWLCCCLHLDYLNPLLPHLQSDKLLLLRFPSVRGGGEGHRLRGLRMLLQ